ncbi:hypothetical protein HanXRQr2_Chr15g0683561 [Helianthus annuus]|uniref:Putative MULE transposase domain-containing protein n=1 Tax=Helianthus annuus TaxID=4232 RepID=A0A251S8C1_HELAN|nr:hypothetical protein HanXRQr2_Chr15g0683561 [Helianthus annuus]
MLHLVLHYWRRKLLIHIYWLLRVFLKVVCSQSKVVVTDQDPAMKKAIYAVFVDTRH